MLQLLKKPYRTLRNLGYDSRASIELTHFGLDYLPWTASALRPAAMVQILNEIIINRRHSIVEFGSGISSIYIAKVLQQTGGHLVSFDDDSEWLVLVRQLLRRYDLEDHVTLVEAPQKMSTRSLAGMQWYDESVVDGALLGKEIQMVIVDGPKAFRDCNKLARYPAFPTVSGNLSKNCCIALDDINRQGEKQVIKRWKGLTEFDFLVNEEHSGMAMCYRGDYFNTRM